jgi:hypothetical protein
VAACSEARPEDIAHEPGAGRGTEDCEFTMGRSRMTATGTGSSSIASRRPVHEASRHFIGIVRTCAVHTSGRRYAAACAHVWLSRSAVRLLPFEPRGSSGLARKDGHHTAPHDARAGARHSRRPAGIRLKAPARRDAADYDV